MKRCVVSGAWLLRYHRGSAVRGFTLVELIVVLALLGVLLGVGGAALATLDVPRESDAVAALRRARAEAIRSGRPVSVTVSWPDTASNHVPRTTHVFWSDGSARGPGLDPLTGRPRAEP